VSAPDFLLRDDGARIAYRRTPARVAGGVGVVFLPGFRACGARGRPFLRFDHFGHGASSGRFEDGTIGRYAADAVAAVDTLTQGPQVLVGSSLGGWLMLLAARARPGRIAGLVGVAAAPDFTEDVVAQLDEAGRHALFHDGVYLEPSPYADEPTPITRRLVEEAKAHLLLAAPIPFRGPVRLLHGLRDTDVPWQKAQALVVALESLDVTLTLVKDGDHRLSTPADLERLVEATEGLCAGLERGGAWPHASDGRVA